MDTTTGRIESIDFWRGLALAIIFINHIPGNVVGEITPRNFGFSDASEAFVFISGLMTALAYGRRFSSGRVAEASGVLFKRALHIYCVHIALTVLALLLFLIAADVLEDASLLAQRVCAAISSAPINGVVSLVTLSWQISYFNILPLYVALLCIAPALLYVGARSRWLMLLLSETIYIVGRSLGSAIPFAPSDQGWYFNPLAWQLMFAGGLFIGLSRPQAFAPYWRAAYCAALLFTLCAAIVVSNAFGVAPGLVDAAGRFLDWDKSNLGTVRIIAFIALAYSIYCSNLTKVLCRSSIYRACSLLGRHSLPVFCLGSLLSALGQILNETRLASPALDIVYVAAGLLVLVEFAKVIESRKGWNSMAAGDRSAPRHAAFGVAAMAAGFAMKGGGLARKTRA